MRAGIPDEPEAIGCRSARGSFIGGTGETWTRGRRRRRRGERRREAEADRGRQRQTRTKNASSSSARRRPPGRPHKSPIVVPQSTPRHVRLLSIGRGSPDRSLNLVLPLPPRTRTEQTGLLSAMSPATLGARSCTAAACCPAVARLPEAAVRPGRRDRRRKGTRCPAWQAAHSDEHWQQSSCQSPRRLSASRSHTILPSCYTFRHFHPCISSFASSSSHPMALPAQNGTTWFSPAPYPSIPTTLLDARRRTTRLSPAAARRP